MEWPLGETMFNIATFGYYSILSPILPVLLEIQIEQNKPFREVFIFYKSIYSRSGSVRITRLVLYNTQYPMVYCHIIIGISELVIESIINLIMYGVS